MSTRTLVCVLCLLALTACATPEAGRQWQRAPVPGPEGRISLGDPAAVNAALGAQHADWLGAPYRLGGMAKDGIDCSGFTYVTFADWFGINLPRTAVAQSKLGTRVSWDGLAPGDLVFFKTGRKDRHVGIYAGSGAFLHASTSQGVTLSSLNSPYWRKNFWQARRLRL